MTGIHLLIMVYEGLKINIVHKECQHESRKGEGQGKRYKASRHKGRTEIQVSGFRFQELHGRT